MESGGVDAVVESYADTISEIVEGFLYIGGCNAPTNAAYLHEKGITFALNVSEDVPAAKVNHYLQLKVADTTVRRKEIDFFFFFSYSASPADRGP